MHKNMASVHKKLSKKTSRVQMKLRYNRNLALCLWTEKNPNTRSKRRKGKKENREYNQKWGYLQLSLKGKKVFINQVMQSKFLCLAYVEKTLSKT